MDIVFSHPGYLTLLFFVPVIFLLHFFSIKFRRSYALKFANFDSIARIKGVDLYSKNLVVLGISCIILFLLIFSLAGATVRTNGNVSSFSFVIAIDSSQSMSANDFSPSRIEAAKQTAIDFVNLVPAGTRIGVISFSGNGIIEQTITSDKQTLKDSIGGVNFTQIGGTDVYNALATAGTLLLNEKNKAIILLSDGQINTGNLQDAISYSIQNNIVVNTIGIATPRGGNTTYGGLSTLDEQSLQTLSSNTGGAYQRAENSASLEGAFNSILQLKQGILTYDLSSPLLIAAILLFVIDYLLSNTRFGSFP